MSVDSWSDDVLNAPTIRKIAIADIHLSPTMIALRDGVAPEPSQAGIARQQRLARMERTDAELGDIIADCDRYAAYMDHLESPCVHNFVPKMMGHYLSDMRRKALDQRTQLRADVATLRKQS